MCLNTSENQCLPNIFINIIDNIDLPFQNQTFFVNSVLLEFCEFGRHSVDDFLN